MTAPQDATLDALLDALVDASTKCARAFPVEYVRLARKVIQLRAKIHAHFAASAQTAAAIGPCNMGVGCDETGMCYALAHDAPERCGRQSAPPPAAQPTDDELRAAWTDAINAESMLGSLAPRNELAELRNRRTTWVGAQQINLRFAIDAYLRGEQP